MARHEAHETLDRWMSQVRMPTQTTIKPLIFDFMRGNSSSEVGCAHLIMMLAGYPVPVQWATNGFDQTRKSWFIRAMMEVMTDQ